MHSGNIGVDRFKLASDAPWSVRLHVKHVLRRRSAEKVEDNHALGTGRAFCRCVVNGTGEISRHPEHAAEHGEATGLKRFTTSNSVTAFTGTAEHFEHEGGLLSR